MKEINIAKYEDTKQQYQNYLDSLNVDINYTSMNNKLTTDISINDLNSEISEKTKFSFSLPKYISRIMFYRNLIANPSRIYSSEQSKSETLNVHFEIYDESADVCSLWIKKVSTPNKVVHSQLLLRDTPSFSSFLYPVVNLSNKGSGEYSISLYGYNDMGNKIFETDRTFFIENSFISSDVEYFEMVNRLLYIATELDMRNLKQTPVSQRESSWYVFWKQHDPTPTTRINEAEDEYFSHIDYCINNFSKGDKGYRSDRAIIYMKYGQPDFVESRPFERQSNAYEIWYYYNIGKQVTFVDSHGFGEFIIFEEKRI